MELEPITREEHFMARAAGASALELEPITREEHFLAAIASGGGGGGGAVSSVNGKTGAVVLTASDLDDSFKEALLDCIANVAWATEDGQQYYDALEATLLYPIDHITAVYTQSGTVYDTDSLESLKADLVVTAFYQGGGSKVVTTYTLSGTLTPGTSTITVSYKSKTTTFDVTVTESNPFAQATYEHYPWARVVQDGHSESIFVNDTTAARAHLSVPLANPNKTFTVTDSTKYNIAVYNVTSLTAEELYISQLVKNVTTYPGTDNNKSWGTSGSSSAPYVALSFKKLDNTEFTDEELANMYGTVFAMS